MVSRDPSEPQGESAQCDHVTREVLRVLTLLDPPLVTHEEAEPAVMTEPLPVTIHEVHLLFEPREEEAADLARLVQVVVELCTEGVELV